MKTWPWLVVCAVLAATAGCRTDPNIVLLERELREQENAIYDLQFCVQDYQNALEAAQRENESLRHQVGGAADKPAAGGSAAKAPAHVEGLDVHIPAEGTAQPPDTLRRSPGPRPSADEPAPKFQPPTDNKNSSPPPTTGARRTTTTSAARPAAPAQWAPRSPLTDSSAVHSVVLNRELTAGFREQGSRTDDGIALCVEPRDSEGRLVEAAAPISVALLDRKGEGEAARVGMWEFTADEIGPMIGKSPQGHGIYLRLPWPAKPAHEQLEVCVRYTTRDGRKLESRQPLDVELTPRAAPESVDAPAPRGAETAPAEPRQATARPRSRSDATAKRPVWSPYR